MDEITKASTKYIYIVLNPVAGHSSAQEIRELIKKYFPDEASLVQIYETTGKENVAELTNKMCKEGVSLVIAAGGDGTVAGVVNGLIGTDVPMGILPVGTGNGLARGLNIPLEVEDALALIAGQHTLQTLDVMQVQDQFYTLNVSAGISSRAMRKTHYENKRRYGMFAYVWVIIQELVRFNPRRFILEIDGHRVELRASEILVSNGAILTDPPKLLGPREGFNDQRFDVHIITARSLVDYLRLVWNVLIRRNRRKTDLKQLTVKKSILIKAVSRPQPVQADGELIGQTPVEVRILPSAVRVIIPLADEEKKAK